MSNAGEPMTNEEAVEILKKLMTAKDISFLHFSQRLAVGMAIEALKQSEQKKGIWKKRVAVHNINGESRNAIVCSICGSGYFRYDTSENTESVMPNYCPNCGAKMEEEDG